MNETARKNAEIARRLWVAASQGDPDPVLEFDPKITWKTYGHGPNAGEFHGIEAVLRYLVASGEHMDEMRSELIDVMSSESGAVIRYRVHMTRGPKRLACEFSLWLRIEDGVVRSIVVVPFEDAASEAFWRVE